MICFSFSQSLSDNTVLGMAVHGILLCGETIKPRCHDDEFSTKINRPLVSVYNY